MTLVGIFGVFLSVASLPFASVRSTRGRSVLAIGLLLAHVSATIIYYWYAQTHVADATGYYSDRFQLGREPFSVGTLFAYKVVHTLRYGAGATLLDCFLLFQSFSFVGIIILMRTFQEINIKIGAAETNLQHLILFLPSVEFWTSAIGKDSPIFLAISLCVWSCLNVSTRFVGLGCSLILMILFRAHIALVVAISLAFASTFHPRFSLGRRVLFLALGCAGAILLVPAVHTTISLNFTDSKSIAAFAEQQSRVASTSGGATTIGNAPIVIRFIDLLFRPLFFDARDVFGIVASIENVLLFSVLVYLWFNRRDMNLLMKRVFFVRFCSTFFLVVVSMLAAVYYNVGTGLRERVMALPPFFCVLVAVWSARQYRVPRGKDHGLGLLNVVVQNERTQTITVPEG